MDLVERFAREDVRRVLRGHGIDRCRRATTTDPTEEVFLLPPGRLAAVDVDGLTKALMNVLPDTKVWVVEDMPPWLSEPV
ncbi:MAG TPA: hypothetical protein VF165_11315 [Nocardioidaceae bacterium]